MIDKKEQLNPENIYFEVPAQMEADLAKALLEKQLETVEEQLQIILDEANGLPHRGQDMIDLAETRDALIKAINHNSVPSEQIGSYWAK